MWRQRLRGLWGWCNDTPLLVECDPTVPRPGGADTHWIELCWYVTLLLLLRFECPPLCTVPAILSLRPPTYSQALAWHVLLPSPYSVSGSVRDVRAVCPVPRPGLACKNWGAASSSTVRLGRALALPWRSDAPAVLALFRRVIEMDSRMAALARSFLRVQQRLLVAGHSTAGSGHSSGTLCGLDRHLQARSKVTKTTFLHKFPLLMS